MSTHHPIQPIERDEHGVVRFKPNAVVVALLDYASERGFDMNKIASTFYDYKHDEDRRQLAQLIGYSLSGYAELPYVDDVSFRAAALLAEKNQLTSDQARIQVLEEELREIKESLRDACSRLFQVHPDDLRNRE